MNGFLTRPLDRWAMRLGTPTVCLTGKRPDQNRDPLQFAPRQALSEVNVPPDFCLAPDGQFSFSSPRPGPFPENNMVRGRLIRSGKTWTRRPTAILVHGWNGEYSYYYLFPYLAWRLRRAGLNTAMLELPYHASRKPKGPGVIHNFLSDDLDAMTEAVYQSLADLRGLLAWLKDAGNPEAGFWGISLGAWLSGLAASQDSATGFVVLLTPVPDMTRAIRELPFCAAIRHCVGEHPGDLAEFGLSRHRPLTSKVLIVQSRHDLFAPPETIEDLWRAWGRPEIWRVPHGHISVLCSLPTLERITRWIARETVPV